VLKTTLLLMMMILGDAFYMFVRYTSITFTYNMLLIIICLLSHAANCRIPCSEVKIQKILISHITMRECS